MKKELLETIDETIQIVCKNIKQSLVNMDEKTQSYYPNDTIKALADLILARALTELIDKSPYSSKE